MVFKWRKKSTRKSGMFPSCECKVTKVLRVVSFTLCLPYDDFFTFLFRIPYINHLLFHVLEHACLLLDAGAVRESARQVLVVVREVHVHSLAHGGEELRGADQIN